MASSDTAQISTIVDLIQIINPSSILDIGCGWGKYGYLCREYLMGDYWDINHTLINALEGYEKNINAVQKEIYNKIIIGSAVQTDKYLDTNYDLIITIDAFEHLSIPEGIKLIKLWKEHSRYLIISIPRFVTTQSGYSDDNKKYEEHRAFWTIKMFKAMGDCIIIPNNARKTIALFTKEPDKLESIAKFRHKKMFLKIFPYIFADIFNYIYWFIHKNNRDVFIKKEKFGNIKSSLGV